MNTVISLVDRSGLDSETFRSLVVTLVDAVKSREGSRRPTSPSDTTPSDGKLCICHSYLFKWITVMAFSSICCL